MLEIANILNEVAIDEKKSGWGNPLQGTLVLKRVDYDTFKLYFGFDTDYSTKEDMRFDIEAIKKEVEKTGILEICDDYDGTVKNEVCSLAIGKHAFMDMAKDIIGLYYRVLKDSSAFFYGGASISLVNKKTNMSPSSYSIAWRLCSDNVTGGKEVIIPIFERVSDNIDGVVYPSLKYRVKEFIKHAADIGSWFSEDIKEILKQENNLKDESLLDLFYYDVCNDHAVILRLKEEYSAEKDLLKYDGFVDMYDFFKIEYADDDCVRFMMAQREGTKHQVMTIGKERVNDYERYRAVLKELQKCIQIKCLIFAP